MQSGRCVNDGPVPHKLDAVSAGCQALNLVEIRLIAGIAVEFVAGVDQRQRVAIDHRRARKTAVLVVWSLRCQRNREVLPVN